MNEISKKMALLMGLTMSFFMTLNGMLSAGRFTWGSFLVSFVIGFVISMLIGRFIPIGKIFHDLEEKYNLKQGEFKTLVIESLVSDLLYTPVMTIVMVTIAYFRATSHGAVIPYVPMVLKALVSSLIFGFILIMIVTPIYTRLLMKNQK